MAPTQTERQLNQARKVEDKEEVKTEDIMEDMEEVKTENIIEDEEEDKTEVKMEDTIEDKEGDKEDDKTEQEEKRMAPTLTELIIPQCGRGQLEGQARKVEDKVEDKEEDKEENKVKDKVEQEEKDHCWSCSDEFHSRGQVASSRESFDWKVVEPYDGNFTFYVSHFTFHILRLLAFQQTHFKTFSQNLFYPHNTMLVMSPYRKVLAELVLSGPGGA